MLPVSVRDPVRRTVIWTAQAERSEAAAVIGIDENDEGIGDPDHAGEHADEEKRKPPPHGVPDARAAHRGSAASLEAVPTGAVSRAGGFIAPSELEVDEVERRAVADLEHAEAGERRRARPRSPATATAACS